MTILLQDYCHPERSEGSHNKKRFFALLRMTENLVSNNDVGVETLTYLTFPRPWWERGRERGQKAAFTLAETLITLGIIGVVAAITIPGLMTAYKKHIIETRLKHSYSLLNQVVKLAQVDYEEPSGWDLKGGVAEFVNTYFLPYMKSDVKIKNIGNIGMLGDTYTLKLMNGTDWIINRYTVTPTGSDQYYHVLITVDINGSAKPNQQGRDRFSFYLFPEKRVTYNTGRGDCAHNVPGPGIYYDGYGFSDEDLKNGYWRGCGSEISGVGDLETDNSSSVNAFCIALIVRNGWKVPSDYPIKL
ncbi:MAG: type II secretion system GspH family protein [Muribaculaceae bacterium]|nr:type II secretion system GspH family protein [Muribaculaceae bacterium]